MRCNLTTVKLITVVLTLSAIVQLTGCALRSGIEPQDGAPTKSVDVSKIPNAVPKQEPLNKSCNKPSYVVNGKRYHVLRTAKGYRATGIASWYGTKFQHKHTASGERFNLYAMTAAHRTLPIPTYVRVTNLKNRKNIIVRINDRGPFHMNRLIDLTYVGAKKLGIAAQGSGLVEVQAIDPVAYAKHDLPPVPKLAHAPHLFLQVGAFAQKHNADRLANRLHKVTHKPVRVSSTIVNHKHIYRVQVGPFASVDQSDSMHNRIHAAGIGNALAVVL